MTALPRPVRPSENMRAFGAMHAFARLCAWTTMLLAAACATTPPPAASTTTMTAALAGAASPTGSSGAATPTTRPAEESAPAPHRPQGSRAAALVTGGLGVAAGAAAIGFAIAGAAQNSSIQNGGFATSQAINDAETTGKRDNEVAYGLGAVSIALLCVGAALYLYSVDSTVPPPKQSASTPLRFAF